MGIVHTSVSWLGMRVSRALVTRPATPFIVAGTLAIAGLGAAVANPTHAHQAPSTVHSATLTIGGPHTFCYPDPDGDGHTVCHVLASDVSTVPNLGCSADPDGDGTFICYYATDPQSSN